MLPATSSWKCARSRTDSIPKYFTIFKPLQSEVDTVLAKILRACAHTAVPLVSRSRFMSWHVDSCHDGYRSVVVDYCISMWLFSCSRSFRPWVLSRPQWVNYRKLQMTSRKHDFGMKFVDLPTLWSWASLGIGSILLCGFGCWLTHTPRQSRPTT